MKKMYLTKIYFSVLIGTLLFIPLQLLKAVSETESFESGFKAKSCTSWKIPDVSNVRGLAFDGKYYYVGIYSEGLIYKYDLNGELVDKIGKNDAPHPYLGHGIATDGKYVWSSDYSVSRKIYQYDISKNKEIKSWTIPMEGDPVRLTYDGTNLWVTVYDSPRVYKLSTEGKLLGSFPIARSDANTGIAAGGKGNIFVSSSVTRQLKLCSPTTAIPGTILKLYNSFPSNTIMATNSSDRNSGLYQMNSLGQIEFFDVGLEQSELKNSCADTTQNLEKVKFSLSDKQPVIDINSNGNITIDGKPFFPLGMYSSLGIDKYSGTLIEGNLPLTKERIISWFSGIKQAGFNMVQTYALCHYGQTDPSKLASLEKRQQGRRLFLDYAQNAGLKVMIWLFEGYPDFRTLIPNFPGVPLPVAREKAWELRKNEIASSIKTLGTHPALLVWNLADEPEPSPQQTKLLMQHYQFTKSLDKIHPIYIVNWQEESIRSQSKCCDIMAEDMYPVGASYGGVGGPNQPKGHWPKIGEIAEWQDWILDTQVNGRPIAWGVVQIHRRPGPESTLRIPTLEEMRAMAFMRLVKNVKGLFFFTFNLDGEQPYMETNPSHWNNVTQVVKSIHTVFPALFSSEIIQGYTVSDKRVYTIMKKVTEDNKIYYYLLAVNPTCGNILPPEDHPIALGDVIFNNIKAIGKNIAVTVLDEDKTGKFHLGNSRKIQLTKTSDSNISFTDNFGKFAVHVYKIGPIE